MIQTGHTELYDELIAVHKQLVHRDNVSSVMVGTCAKVEKDYFSSIAAGLLTLGGTHAPIVKTYEFLSRGKGCPSLASAFLKRNIRVPGWGSSFIKAEKDPIFENLDKMLSDFRIHEHIWSTTSMLQEEGAFLFPNAACYTAAVAITLDIPKDIAGYALIQGRLDGWTEIYYQNFTGFTEEEIDEPQRDEVD
jgi:citrate synthase